MTGFRNHGFTLASIGLTVGAALGTATLSGCPGGGGICGPCGSVLEGSVGISGNAQLDGFFSAVASVGDVTASVQGEFDGNIRALAEVWGFADLEGEINADYVASLMAHIRGEIDAAIGVDGGLAIDYVPPACSASLNVAVDAQANCEASAGCECEVEVDPGEVSVSCEGTCSGGCSAGCTGMAACNAAVQGGIECSGSCEGTCELNAQANAMCEGTCNGTCNGNCSVENGDGSCAGECDGTCEGNCELSASGSGECGGTCHGTCVAEAPALEGSCMAEIECRGECSGECSGSCQGSAKPPMASADCECEASADCQASASAQADASVECTPPSLDIRFEISASGNLMGNASAEATFRARLGELRVRGVAILQGFAQMGAIVTGEVNGEVVFNPSPVARIQAEFSGVIDAAASGEFEIAPGRIDCVVPALREAAELIGSVVGETSGTLQAQAEFSTSLFAIAG